MNKPFDVIVVGAGIVGVSTALHLLMRGQNVLLIDRRGVGQETSYGNSGIIESSYVLPFRLPSAKHMLKMLVDHDTAVRIGHVSWKRLIPWLAQFYLQSQPHRRTINGRRMRPLVEKAVEEHKFLMATTDAARHLSHPGRVKLHRTEQSYAASSLERTVARELSVEFDDLSVAEFSQIEADLKPVYFRAVRWSDSARLNNPGAVVEAYGERFCRAGGAFRRASVEQLENLADRSWTVTTGQGRFSADHVVICAGPWAAGLLEPLGYKFPLFLKRGYHQHFAAEKGANLTHAIVDADIGYLICPMEQGYRITTGIEFAQLNTAPTPKQMARVMPYARELFPLGESLEPIPWFGSRPCTPDSLPIVGQAPRHPQLWLNIAHGHSGMTIGPSTGRLLAEMLIRTPTFCDPLPYRAERF